jgi:hypothetical protein
LRRSLICPWREGKPVLPLDLPQARYLRIIQRLAFPHIAQNSGITVGQ